MARKDKKRASNDAQIKKVIISNKLEIYHLPKIESFINNKSEPERDNQDIWDFFDEMWLHLITKSDESDSRKQS